MANKQTDKSEVNKYVLVLMDPALISAPPGPEILNVLTNPPTGKQEEVFQYRVENQRVPGTLTWKRKIIHFTVAAGQPGKGNPGIFFFYRCFFLLNRFFS